MAATLYGQPQASMCAKGQSKLRFGKDPHATSSVPLKTLSPVAPGNSHRCRGDAFSRQRGTPGLKAPDHQVVQTQRSILHIHRMTPGLRPVDISPPSASSLCVFATALARQWFVDSWPCYRNSSWKTRCRQAFCTSSIAEV